MKKLHRMGVRLLAVLFVLGTVQAWAQDATQALPRTLVPAERLGDAWWKERHEANKTRIAQGDVDLLLVGDSITHGWDGNGKDVQQYYYGDRKSVNMGFGGDQPQHVLWRLNDAPMDKISPKAAVLLIGVNSLWGTWDDCEVGTARGVQACVDKLLALYPNIKILVLNIFIAGDPSKTDQHQRIARTNELLPGLLCGEKYKNVQIKSLNHLWTNADGQILNYLLPDYCHPNQLGYKLWGAEVEPIVAEMLGDKAKAALQ